MTQSSKNNNFTAADIERYHAGTMLPGERHALEKAALDDPFLADALEGYALAPTPAADLQQLHARLQKRLEEKKKRPLFALPRTWLSAAALLFLMAGGAWMYFSFLQPRGELAKETPNEEVRKANTVQAPVQNKAVDSVNSSTLYKSGNDNAADVAAAPEPGPATHKAESKTEGRLVPGALQRQMNTRSNDGIVTAAPLKKGFSTTYTTTAPSTTWEGYTSAVRSGDSVHKELKVHETRMDDVKAAPADKYANRQVSGDTIKNMNIVMKPLNQQNAEVVVLGKGVTRRADRESFMNVKVDTLEPAEGWTKFDDYVAANLKAPEGFQDKREAGTVVLAFDVNTEGAPVNITVVKSLCGKCDEEAIRLLKEGPRWKKKNKGKGKVTIHF